MLPLWYFPSASVLLPEPVGVHIQKPVGPLSASVDVCVALFFLAYRYFWDGLSHNGVCYIFGGVGFFDGIMNVLGDGMCTSLKPGLLGPGWDDVVHVCCG